MSELLKEVIDAHGGMDAWRKFSVASAQLSVGGILWELKGHKDTFSEVEVEVSLQDQKVSHIPNSGWRTRYTPEHVAIESNKYELLEELSDPRASFKNHSLETKWSNIQLAYFAGYAMWNYMNMPFLFAEPGFELNEVDPWVEDSERLRRLRIKWPKYIHTHSGEQVLYIASDGLIRRFDYQVEIAGNASVAHYLYDYRNIGGIKMATRRIVFQRKGDDSAWRDGPIVVSIDLSKIKLS